MWERLYAIILIRRPRNLETMKLRALSERYAADEGDPKFGALEMSWREMTPSASSTSATFA